MVPAVCYDFRKQQKEILCIDYHIFHIYPVPLHHQPGRLLPHGLRQAPRQERALADSGENALPVCRPGRFRRSAPGHVYLPSQNQTLVFRDRYAPDPDPAGGRRHLAGMAPVTTGWRTPPMIKHDTQNGIPKVFLRMPSLFI